MAEKSTTSFRFALVILNDDGSEATRIETDDVNYESALSEFQQTVKDYVAEGYDGLSMRQEPNPARYGAS